MDDEHKHGLYRWQRQTKPVVQSRAHKVTTPNDIQDWIKTVENASTKATDAAFGLVESGRKKGKVLAETRTRQARVDEEAHSEAQELLRQWVTDKVHFDADDGYDDLEAWRRARSQQREKSQASSRNSKGGTGTSGIGDEEEEESASAILNNIRLDDDDWEIDEAAIYERVKRSALGEEDPYAHLYEMDDSEAVSSVLKTLMSKNVVKEAFKKDLGFDENNKLSPDPRTKMELRHQMVKDNREKRQKEELKKIKERQMKKEARVKAQQMIVKEQRDKEAQVRKEEEEIKKEMMSLRKEMAMENRQKEEKVRREREERAELERLAREELEREKFEEDRLHLESRRMESERRKQRMIKQELWKTKQEAKNLKSLHLHFNAWYDHVLSRRLLLGKIKAMSDWKVMVRVWGAWKSYVRGQRAQVASVQHEKEVIEVHRKTLASENHYRHRLLRKCLNSWRYFVKQEVDRREMEAEQERTKNKMISLLNAVAEGRMLTEKSKTVTGFDTDRSKSRMSSNGNSEKEREDRNGDKNNGGSHSSYTNHRVQAWVDNDKDEDVESQYSDLTNVTRDTSGLPFPSMSSRRTTSRPSSTMSGSTGAATSDNRKGRKSIPTQAWQVTKQHTQLAEEDIRKLGQGHNGDDDSDETDRVVTDGQIRKRFGSQPWMNHHYVVNNFEHRYNAQQRALRQQQEEIKEQKRLIQDLQYKQQQQLLRQQLATGVVSHDPPVDIEVPPKGHEIPRDVNDNSNHTVKGPGNPGTGGGGIVVHSGTGSTTRIGTTRPVSGSGQSQSDLGQPMEGPTTDRSSLSTERTVSDSSKVSNTSHNTKYLKALKNMEERSAQRARQKAERDERRRKQEDEKLAQLERLEAERQREMEEEKKAKVEAFRQKKRLEKQKEEQRQKEATRQQELLDRAKAHYERSIMKYRGLLPLKKLISLSKRNWNRAVKHRNQSLMRQTVREWKMFTLSEIQRKNDMADQMGQFLLVKHSFDRWRKHKYHTEFLLCRAERHFESCLKWKVFHVWVQWKDLEKVEVLARMERAEQYYWDHLLRSRFLAWKLLPEKQKREEERKKRKMEMRQRVAELIPDYAPHQSVDKCLDASADFG